MRNHPIRIRCDEILKLNNASLALCCAIVADTGTALVKFVYKQIYEDPDMGPALIMLSFSHF